MLVPSDCVPGSLQFLCDLKKRPYPLKEMFPCLFDKETNFRGGDLKKHFFVALTKQQKIAPCDIILSLWQSDKKQLLLEPMGSQLNEIGIK